MVKYYLKEKMSRFANGDNRRPIRDSQWSRHTINGKGLGVRITGKQQADSVAIIGQ